jgi:hypothetical protein
VSANIPDSILRVKVWYDDSFLNHPTIGTTSKARQFLEKSLDDVQKALCLDSLGAHLNIQVVEFKYVPGTMVPSGNVGDFRDFVNGDTVGADVQLGYMRDCHNSAGGWAFIGGLCTNNAVAIGCTGGHQNEKGMSDIMAHEIGHVLGMFHDVDVGCHGGQGHMSGVHSKWSSCSTNYFQNYYNDLESQGKWCLPTYSGTCGDLFCKNSGQYSDDQCSGWKAAGFCTITWIGLEHFVDFMFDHCKKTCGC